jgi:nicotianamine synthase
VTAAAVAVSPATPSPDRLPPGEVADRIVALYDELERLAAESELEPGDPTDGLFAGLVDLCAHRSEPDAAAVLADPRVRAAAGRLRRLCAEGEFRLERSWAHRISAATDPEREFAAFPYLDNYRALTALELNTIAGLRPGHPEPGRVCVLGSGPLPLTALLIARTLGATVEAVDLDPEATGLAGDVLRRLAGGGLVQPRTDDAGRSAGASAADVVVLAALVGLDPVGKREVIAAVARRLRPGALLLVRSAHRLRTLLYPPCTVDDLVAAGDGQLRPLAELHPMTDVVNSVVIAVRT